MARNPVGLHLNYYICDGKEKNTYLEIDAQLLLGFREL